MPDYDDDDGYANLYSLATKERNQLTIEQQISKCLQNIIVMANKNINKWIYEIMIYDSICIRKQRTKKFEH